MIARNHYFIFTNKEYKLFNEILINNRTSMIDVASKLLKAIHNDIKKYEDDICAYNFLTQLSIQLKFLNNSYISWEVNNNHQLKY